METRKFDPYNSDIVDLMTPEELNDVCHLLCNLSWSDYCEETLTGCIIKTFMEWKCDLYLRPFTDPGRAVRVRLFAWPTEFEIVSPSLKKAFVKTGQVLGKWSPKAMEVPKTTPDAPKTILE